MAMVIAVSQAQVRCELRFDSMWECTAFWCNATDTGLPRSSMALITRRRKAAADIWSASDGSTPPAEAALRWALVARDGPKAAMGSGGSARPAQAAQHGSNFTAVVPSEAAEPADAHSQNGSAIGGVAQRGAQSRSGRSAGWVLESMSELRGQVEAIFEAMARGGGGDGLSLERQSYIDIIQDICGTLQEAHVLLQDYPEDSQIRVKDFLDILFTSEVHKAESRVREGRDVKEPSRFEAQNEEPSSSSNGKEVKVRKEQLSRPKEAQKETKEQRTEAETGASEAEVPKVSKASLKDYFEKNYKQGRLFDHEEYRHDPKDWCWLHTRLDVKVWQDALDLTQADDASDVQCLFHYTNELGFKNITDLRKTAVELFASLITTGEKANAWWGAGVYSVQKPPDEWPNLERLLDNNYRRMLKRDIDLKGREAAVKEYRSRVSFCIPILVNASMAYDVSKRRTPEMVKQGKPVGVNLAGMPLNEDGMPPRQCFVIRVDTEEEVGNARAVLMEAVRCRAKAIEERLGSEHFETLKASSRLANALTARGDCAKAEPLCRRVLANYETATLREVHKLMETMYYAGNLAEAETLCRRAVIGRERVLGEMHAETLESVNDLGLVLRRQGKLKEAELFSRRGLEGRERLLGRMHPDTLGSVNNLALVLNYQGKRDEAEGLYRRALAGFEAQLGAHHPDTLTSVHNLAVLLYQQGKLQDAEGLYRRALAGKDAQLGAGHPDTLNSVFSLALLLEAKGGHAEVEELLLRALNGYEEVHGPEHQITQMVRSHLERFRREHSTG
ncbi:unnamed protein product [Durusdinium trenchii]|uniref:Kinesin light chain n=1 Tax=Durusdinium trenchii TaxID=1381693 RepID=A0ABP0PJC5_9DINO